MLQQTELQRQKSFNPNDQNIEKDADVNIGKWTNQENLKYAIFMDFHKVTLSSRQKKKNFRVFEEMAKFVGSRNTVQCRSHHQKLQERFKHFKKIISAIKNQIGRKQYKLYFKKWTNSGTELICIASQIKTDMRENEREIKEPARNQENVQKKVETKAEDVVFTPTIFPFFSYPPFQSAFAYSMPNIYGFTSPYY